MEQHHFDYSQIPQSWQYCFNHECPMHQDCLRYLTAQQQPADHEWGNAVFPAALKDGQCRFYRQAVKVRLATGFVISDNPHMSQLFVNLRHQLAAIIGNGGTYYLYRNGKKWLTPAQQQAIQKVFHDAGYPDEVQYAQYQETYDFT